MHKNFIKSLIELDAHFSILIDGSTSRAGKHAILFDIQYIESNRPTFKLFRYMYTGILDLRDQVGSNVLDLLVASDELLMEELVTFVQKYLIENQPDWLQDNFVKVLHTVFRFENYKQLQDYCLESICDDPVSFFNSANVSTLEKHILLEIIFFVLKYKFLL